MEGLEQGQDNQPLAEGAQPPSVFARAAAGLAWLGGALSTSLVLIILGLVTYAVVQRYVLERPLVWSDPVAGYLVVGLMLGAAEALRRGDHISMDLLVGRFGARGRRFVAYFSDLAVLVIAVVLGWSCWEQISFAYDFGSFTADHLEIPSWIPMAPLLAACVLLALMAAARLLDALPRGAQR